MADPKKYEDQTPANKAMVDLCAWLDNVPCKVRHADGRHETLSLFQIVSSEFPWGEPMMPILELEKLFDAATERPELKGIFLAFVAREHAMACVHREHRDNQQAANADHALTQAEEDMLRREAYMRAERGQPKKSIIADLMAQHGVSKTMLAKVLPTGQRGRPSKRK